MNRSLRPAPSKWSSISTPIALLLLGAAYLWAYLRLQSRWWFEDDPSLFAYANEIHNPASVFFDPSLLRHFTTGKALVPMQLVSYWVDTRLAKLSPAFAYAHQAFSFLLTLLVLYFLLVQLLRNNKAAAFGISFLWMLAPSTLVVVQFLATRHYLEGLFFAILAVFVLSKSGLQNGACDWRAYAIAFACGVIAALYKEIYAVIVPALFLGYAWKYKSRGLALGAVAMTIAYGAYRLWMLGAALDYNMAFLSAPQYLKFLSKLPYTLSSNYGGYILWGIIAALCAYSARAVPTDKERRGPLVFGIAVLVGLCIATIVPVSYPLYGTIRVPGTWYRIVFLLNTVLLVSGGCLAVRFLTTRRQLALGLLTMIGLGAGAAKTDKLWVAMTARAESEGKFYLNNPDKVLLSEQEAWWFIPGVHWMYGVKNPHYVLLKDVQGTRTESPVWRDRNGGFAPVSSPLGNVESSR